jgi:hypothetical protein
MYRLDVEEEFEIGLKTEAYAILKHSILTGRLTRKMLLDLVPLVAEMYEIQDESRAMLIEVQLALLQAFSGISFEPENCKVDLSVYRRAFVPPELLDAILSLELDDFEDNWISWTPIFKLYSTLLLYLHPAIGSNPMTREEDLPPISNDSVVRNLTRLQRRLLKIEQLPGQETHFKRAVIGLLSVMSWYQIPNMDGRDCIGKYCGLLLGACSELHILGNALYALRRFIKLCRDDNQVVDMCYEVLKEINSTTANIELYFLDVVTDCFAGKSAALQF